MDNFKRVPATMIIDGDACPVYYDPSLYRQAVKFVPAERHVIQIADKTSRNPEECKLVQVTYPRSGTHLVQQLIQLIVNGGRSAKTFAAFFESAPILELSSQETMAHATLLRTHLPMNRMQFSHEAKYVYVARNPWDFCVSNFHLTTDFPVFEFGNRKFEDFLDVFLRGQAGFGDYFDHVFSGYALKDCPNVLFLTYEEIQKNKTDVILRLANFLGDAYGAVLKDNREALAQVVEKSELPFMKGLIPSNYRDLIEVFCQGTSSINATQYVTEEGTDSDIKVANIVRRGGLGGWKAYFSDQSRDKMRAMISEKWRETSIMDLWQFD